MGVFYLIRFILIYNNIINSIYLIRASIERECRVFYGMEQSYDDRGSDETCD